MVNKSKWVVPMLVFAFIFMVACTNGEEVVSNDTANNEDVEAGNFNEEGFPIVDEPIELYLMGQRAPIQGSWEDLKFFQEIQELTNIHFEFDTPSTDGYDERLNLTLASGDLPDLFFAGGLSPQDEIQYGSQDMLIPLEELIAQYAPNIQNMLDEDPNIERALTAPDGHIYGLPHIHAGFGNYWPKFWINQSWLDELGLDMPQSTTELYDVLRAFAESDPSGQGTIPLTSIELNDIRPGFLNAFGFVADAGSQMAVVADAITFVPMEDNYRAYLEYMNTLYTEQLLDPETFAQTIQQKNAKGEDGRLGMFFDAAPFLTTGMDLNEDYILVPPLTSKVNDQQIAEKSAGIGTGVFAITSDNPHPEATIRFVDYFYSQDGALLMTWGIEGDDWEWTEDGGVQTLYPEDVEANEYRAGEITPDAGSSLPKDHRLIDELAQIGEEEVDPINYGLRRITDEVLVPHAQDGFPQLRFTEEESNRISTLRTDIETYVSQMEARFINGQESLDNWEEYTSTLEDMNVQEYIDIYQEAYERWKSAG